jgi:hypothetical protein
MKISSTSLLGEKSHSLLQDIALLPEDLILLAQPRELLADILMRTFEQTGLLMLRTPPAQRRFRYAGIMRNLLNAPPAGLDRHLVN